MGFFKHENLGGFPENNLWNFSSIGFQRNIGGNFCGTFKHEDSGRISRKKLVGFFKLENLEGSRGKSL